MKHAVTNRHATCARPNRLRRWQPLSLRTQRKTAMVLYAKPRRAGFARQPPLFLRAHAYAQHCAKLAATAAHSGKAQAAEQQRERGRLRGRDDARIVDHGADWCERDAGIGIARHGGSRLRRRGLMNDSGADDRADAGFGELEDFHMGVGVWNRLGELSRKI